MKTLSKLVLFCFVAVLLGCQPSADMIRAEIEFYKAQVEFAKAQGGGNQPLLIIEAKDPTQEMVFSNVASITVFSPPQPQHGPIVSQYVQTDYSKPWVNMATGIVGIAGAVAGTTLIAHELKGFGGGTNYNALGQNSSIKVQGASSANINGNTTGSVGNVDMTSTPTVVEQPPPVIVTQPEPVVVNPVVVGQ